MKLNKREKFILRNLVENPDVSNLELATSLQITTQAIGKIKKKLHSKGIIVRKEVVLDYEKMGIALFTVALIKVLPNAFKNFNKEQLDDILQPTNVIESFTIPKTNVTHIMIYAFRDVEEYDNYFKALLTELGEYIEIKNTYVFSSKSITKASPKDLFLELLKEQEEPAEEPSESVSQ